MPFFYCIFVDDNNHHDMNLQELQTAFQTIYGCEAEHAYFAPGRVNLIGEHTDYNGGHVFPCALSMGNYAVARKRNDDKLRLYSINFDLFK